jgi:23S rRNA (pseudouridine1915-N3)-methyltransferase
MRLRIVALGDRMPKWVDAAVDDYLARIRAPWQVELVEVAPVRRTPTVDGARAIAREGARVLEALRPGEVAIALDEHGRSFDTRELAARLVRLERDAQPAALLLGGADGHAPEVRARCTETWSLSRLTFPHALARVLVAEQLYRAQSLLLNHPYHRGDPA